MSTKTRRVALRVPEPTHRILRREARRLGVPVTVVVMGFVTEGTRKLDGEGSK